MYLQVVVYDDTARRYSSYIHVGDHVSVIGDLKVKSYAKKDRTAGTALIIERPVTFFKIVSGNSEPQLQPNTVINPDTGLEEPLY